MKNQKNKQAIIFDNDGVLVNTEPLFFQATQQMCALLGLELSLQQFIDCHIKSSKATWHLLDVQKNDIPRWRNWRNDRYSQLLQQSDLRNSVVEQLIADLAEHYRLCVVTSSRRSHFELIHRQSTYLNKFEFVITLEDVSASKPSPQPYQKALERLQLTAADCLVVEDSFRGLQSARTAGIDCVTVNNEFSSYQDLSGAAAHLENISELRDFVGSF